MSINKVILVGNVGKDPVIRYFDKGVAKATFPMATSETYTNQQGETITTTEWHNIVLWRALAEVAEKTVKKGTQLYIVGKIKTRSYVDKDGNNKYITEILADTMLVLERKQGQGTYQGHQEGRSDVAEKGATGSGVGEPGTPYQPSGGLNDRSQTNKETFNGDEPGPGGPFSNGPGAGQNEDDLPF
jgi:single-strand DNA-binding protein